MKEMTRRHALGLAAGAALASVALPALAEEAAELPAPREIEGDYSVDASAITIAENLQDYLGREDVVYIDLRDYADYAKTHFRNFECVPYFALIHDMGDETELGTQLFYGALADPKAAYVESEELLEEFIPRDKTVFLMCQSGGRVNMCMQLLDALGYDMSCIYNVGGMAQAEGNAALYDYTTNTLEIVADVAYSFEGLTPAE